ncbi:MAG: Crp/Fnr family transcriptional regulator [Bacteroidota bacterium]|nr:Crp/Fnr family transcriptional regulator [Bacteroidota bacterium]
MISSSNSKTTNCLECNYKSDCFKKLIQSELEFISKNKTQIKYQKGETIYKEGTFSSDIMYIVDGSAQKYIEGTNKFILKILQKNEFIGLPSLFCSKEHCFYSVSAITDTTVCLIKKDKFKKLLTTNSIFAQEVIKWYCKDDEYYFNRFKSISNKNMHGRLAEILLYLNNNENFIKTACITRKFLAEFAGISVESTIRILSSLKKDKIIYTNGKSIKILNIKSLKQISENG